jgi:hypothetical protein
MATMRHTAQVATLPDNHGFILMVVPYGSGEGRLEYLSNLKREDAINLLKEFLIKEFLIKCGAEEDWMKHIR